MQKGVKESIQRGMQKGKRELARTIAQKMYWLKNCRTRKSALKIE